MSDDNNKNNGSPPTFDDTIDRADRTIVLKNGDIITLEDLLMPGYSECNNCPLAPHRPILGYDSEGNPMLGNSVPGKCPSYQKNSHCTIEEAIVLETVYDFNNREKIPGNKYSLYALLTAIVNKHRVDRLGQNINLQMAPYSKFHAEIVTKYMSMANAVNTQYLKTLKEKIATEKENIKLVQTATKAANILQNQINRAQDMEKIKEHNREAGKNHQFNVRSMNLNDKELDNDYDDYNDNPDTGDDGYGDE
jgi:hypothetical protein